MTYLAWVRAKLVFHVLFGVMFRVWDHEALVVAWFSSLDVSSLSLLVFPSSLAWSSMMGFYGEGSEL